MAYLSQGERMTLGHINERASLTISFPKNDCGVGIFSDDNQCLATLRRPGDSFSTIELGETATTYTMTLSLRTVAKQIAKIVVATEAKMAFSCTINNGKTTYNYDVVIEEPDMHAVLLCDIVREGDSWNFTWHDLPLCEKLPDHVAQWL